MEGPNIGGAPEDILARIRTQERQLLVRVDNVLTRQRGDPNRMVQARQRAMELSQTAETVSWYKDIS